MSQDRIHAFDIAKMVAIYAVIITHCAGVIGGMEEIRLFIETFYLSLFFFISGFVTNSHRQNTLSINAFLFEKFKRLLVPFVSIVLISSLVNLLFTGQMGLKSIFIDDTKGGYWFIFVLFIFNAIFLIQRKVINYFNLTSITSQAIIYGIPWIIIVLLCSSLPSTIISLFSLSSCRRYYLFFILGYLSKSANIFSKITKSNISKIVILVGYVLMSLIYVIYVKRVDTNMDFFLWFITNLFGISFWIILLMIIERYLGLSSYLINIGQSSLGIYLYHYFVLDLVLKIPCAINKYLYLLLASIFVLSVTYYFTLIISHSTILSKFLLGKFK